MLFTYLDNLPPLGVLMHNLYRIYGVAMLVGASAYMLYAPYSLMREHKKIAYGSTRKRSNRLRVLFLLLLCLYPLGNGFKFLIIGPDFIRFHLSDVGFPVFLAWTMSSRLDIRLRQSHNSSYSSAEITLTRALMTRYLPIALLLSYGYEIFVRFAHANSDGRLADSPIGSFDWWDILAYTVGFGLAFVITYMRRAAALTMNAEYQEYLERLREYEASMPPKQRKRKKQYSRTNRRGGRK